MNDGAKAYNVFEAWDRARELLLPAVAELKGTHTIDDICLMVGSGHFRVWMGERSVVLSEFFTTPRIKTLNLFLCGGDLTELRGMLDRDLIPFAKQNGCTRITGAGREGWSRAPSDWTRGGVYMHIDI